MKRNLQEYLQKCLAMCDECGIPYGKIDSIVEDKAEKRWGQCRHRNGKTIIGISYKLIDTTYSETDMGLINTIIHEILHTCPRCGNHGSVWKSYASKIYNRFGYNIKRTSSCEEKGAKENEDKYKYIIKCKDCGCEWKYMRFTKAVQFPEKFSHTKCGKYNIIRVV